MNSVYGCVYEGYRRGIDANYLLLFIGWEREALRFQIEHIPGSQNVVADGLTRIFHVDDEKLPGKIKYCFKEDSTQRIFHIEEEDAEDANPQIATKKATK